MQQAESSRDAVQRLRCKKEGTERIGRPQSWDEDERYWGWYWHDAQLVLPVLQADTHHHALQPAAVCRPPQIRDSWHMHPRQCHRHSWTHLWSLLQSPAYLFSDSGWLFYFGRVIYLFSFFPSTDFSGHSWKKLHSVLSCRLIWQSWQSYCNWFYQGNPFLPPTVIFVSLIVYSLYSLDFTVYFYHLLVIIWFYSYVLIL